MNRNLKQSQKSEPVHVLDVTGYFFIILIIGLLGYVLVRYFLPGPDIALLYSVNEVLERNVSSIAPVANNQRPFHDYEEGIKVRDLFQPLDHKVDSSMTALEKALPALNQRIKLIGILLDGDSKAIIEDLEEKQTYFVSKGESIGMVFLEDIREDKVIFMYNNKRVEMAP